MANFTVQSASTSYTGTDTADNFLLNTAGGVTVSGLAGDDLFTAAAATNYASASLSGGDGADTFNLLTTAVFSATSLTGGNGADVLNLTDATTNLASFLGGNDTDTFTLNSATLLTSTFALGADADGFVATRVSLQGTSIKLGAGLDTATLLVGDSFRSSTIELGGGDDTFAASGVATFTTVGGSDGRDTIAFDASSWNTAAAVSLGGGSGNDTITLTDLGQNIVSAFGTIQGGGGNDTINLVSANASRDGLIYGGLGADTINLRDITTGGAWAAAAGNVSVNNALAYASAQESYIGSLNGANTMDVVSGVSSGGVTTTTGQFTTVQLDTVTFQNITSGRYSNNAVQNSAGMFFFGSNSAQLTTLASRVSTLDSDLTVGGQAATFFDGQNANVTYLFVQGGSAGTSDDLLVRFNAASGVAIGNISNQQIGLFNNQAYATS